MFVRMQSSLLSLGATLKFSRGFVGLGFGSGLSLGGSRDALALVPTAVGSFLLQQTRTATKKAGGTSKNGRDSLPKYLGVKKLGGHQVIPGNIIIRQRGLKYRPGDNVGVGKDHTIYALSEGFVEFKYCLERRRQVVSVVSKSPYKHDNPKAIQYPKTPKMQKNNSILTA